MGTNKIKLDYNSLMRQIDDVIGAESIETVRKCTLGIAIGVSLLGEYLRELAEHAIETEDEFLLKWCFDLMIIKETDGEIMPNKDDEEAMRDINAHEAEYGADGTRVFREIERVPSEESEACNNG